MVWCSFLVILIGGKKIFCQPQNHIVNLKVNVLNKYYQLLAYGRSLLVL
jgi:hypothetical protein